MALARRAPLLAGSSWNGAHASCSAPPAGSVNRKVASARKRHHARDKRSMPPSYCQLAESARACNQLRESCVLYCIGTFRSHEGCVKSGNMPVAQPSE